MLTLKRVAENHGLTQEGVDYALRQYGIIISEITHGMLSKLSYDAHDVLRYAQERWCEACELKEADDPNLAVIVPCRQCRFWVSDDNQTGRCFAQGVCNYHLTDGDWFCADGERE